MKNPKFMSCVLAAMIMSSSVSFHADAKTIQKPVQAIPTINMQKPTKVISYEGGCFDAKAGNKFLLRCV
jgi:hypothetical protein